MTFGSPSAFGHFGEGARSAIAVAVHRRHLPAIDDRRTSRQALRTDGTLRTIDTPELSIPMIREGRLDFPEADAIRDEPAARYRFRMALASFREVPEGC